MLRYAHIACLVIILIHQRVVNLIIFLLLWYTVCAIFPLQRNKKWFLNRTEIVKYVLNDGTCGDGRSLSTLFLPTVCTQVKVGTCVMDMFYLPFDYQVQGKGQE